MAAFIPLIPIGIFFIADSINKSTNRTYNDNLLLTTNLCSDVNTMVNTNIIETKKMIAKVRNELKDELKRCSQQQLVHFENINKSIGETRMFWITIGGATLISGSLYYYFTSYNKDSNTIKK
jgi:hypothetical protein